MAALERDGRRYDLEGILSANEAFAGREAPELLEEIEGIAESAGIAYRDLLILNLPLYIVGSHLPLDCSQILLQPPATAGGNTYLAKTRDFVRGNFAHVVTHRTYADGRELIEVNAAGSVTWPGSGLNSDGVAMSTSGVWSRRTPIDIDSAGKGWLLINVHLLLRESRSLAEFEDRLAAQPRLTGLNIVAADRSRGAALEATRDRVYRHEPEDGVLVRTNHYVAADAEWLSPTREEYPHTYCRYEVARARLAAARGSWDLASLTRLVGSHEEDPTGSLCRHLDRGSRADTVYASVASLADGRFWSILDNPCQAAEIGSAV
jgi:isopenicillin-N N-acyltransferase-like protein